MAVTRLGRVQLRIMQVLWDKGSATAREITDAMNEEDPIAHSTVQTLLRGLEEKQATAHRVDGRTFVFYPIVRREAFQQSAARELIERAFGGRAASLVAHLLKNERVSRAEIQELRELIDRRAHK